MSLIRVIFEKQTGFGSGVTSRPPRASTCARSPPMWTAETAGGDCIRQPMKPQSAESIISSVMCPKGALSTASPLASSVEVRVPKLTTVS